MASSAQVKAGANRFPRGLIRACQFPCILRSQNLKPADTKSTGASGVLEAPVIIGGPSRTRTLDPLIKSPIRPLLRRLTPSASISFRHSKLASMSSKSGPRAMSLFGPDRDEVCWVSRTGSSTEEGSGPPDSQSSSLARTATVSQRKTGVAIGVGFQGRLTKGFCDGLTPRRAPVGRPSDARVNDERRPGVTVPRRPAPAPARRRHGGVAVGRAAGPGPSPAGARPRRDRG
jgi:hypothetical protein